MTRILDDVKISFDDVFLVPKRSTLKSRKDFEFTRKFKFIGGTREWFGICAANMTSVGTMEMAEALAPHKMLTALHKFYTLEQLGSFIGEHMNDGVLDCVFFTFGTTFDDIAKSELLLRSYRPFIKNVCFDVANGYSEGFLDVVKVYTNSNRQIFWMAGNVCTPDMTQELILGGVTAVKVGIGPGLACTTRDVTGVGYPQLSAILECADAAHGLGGYICADGGCKTTGDIAKAFGAGADFVMIGGMLAGHDEAIEDKTKIKTHKVIQSVTVTNNGSFTDSSVETVDVPDEIQDIEFYGMSSEEAMEKHYGGVAEHRAPEGKSMKIPYKGPVAKMIQNIKGGLASSGSYIGSRSIKDFPRCATFCRTR